jgi:serine/threonine-protein kinase
MIGATFDSKYRLDALIGSGGMATVFRAHRLMIGDDVALKVLHKDTLRDPQAVDRFRREAQAAARLRHPNAVNIYDFGISGDGTMFLVMELVTGTTLRSLLREQGRLPAVVAAQILTQTCGALGAAHEQQVVHRDVKPDNIMVTQTPNGPFVKVLDFGIARIQDVGGPATLTQAGMVMGTPHYMSPEQCLGYDLDGRSDIYSAGIVFYEMLLGAPPFKAPTGLAVIHQHIYEPPPPMRQADPSISPRVEAVTMRALEKHVEARPPTAFAFAAEMNAAVSGGPPPLGTTRIMTPATRPFPQAPTTPNPTHPMVAASLPTPAAVPATVPMAPVSATAPVAPHPQHKKHVGPIAMATSLAVAFAALSGWLWFHRSQPAPPPPTSDTAGATPAQAGPIVFDAATAATRSAQVTSATSPILGQPSNSAPVLVIVRAGATLAVSGVSTDWLRVQVPGDPAGSARIGYIARTAAASIAPLDASPSPAPATSRVAPPPTPAPTRAAAPPSLPPPPAPAPAPAPAAKDTPAQVPPAPAPATADDGLRSRLAIFVSVPERDGFLDSSKATLDSVNDLARLLRKSQDLSLDVVDDKRQANVILTVVKRGHGVTEYGERKSIDRYYGHTEISMVPITASTYWVSAVLESGTYKKEFTGTQVNNGNSGITYGAWSNCANQIARNVTSWMAANEARLRRNK